MDALLKRAPAVLPFDPVEGVVDSELPTRAVKVSYKERRRQQLVTRKHIEGGALMRLIEK